MELSRARARALLVGASLLLLVGCSGVPSSSEPQVVRPISGGVAPSSAAVVTPPNNADERQIVNGFLDANVSEDAHHTGARGYLTADAAKKWVDTTTSVVTSYSTSVANLQTHAVTVTAYKMGAVDAHGIYTPVTQESGTTPLTLTFEMLPVSGQWRINTLSNGLIVDQSHFLQTYKPHPVYFFDQSQRRLVPDLRYSALADQTLCTWLLEQLISGPRPELQSVYSDLPEQTAHAAVTFGNSAIVVDLPGATQLDAQTKVRLAVQLAFTFRLDGFAPKVTLTDSTKAVPIPQTASPFDVNSFSATYPVSSSTRPPVYYVHGGAVVDESGNPVAGPAGLASAEIVSIAIGQRSGSPLLAATKGKPDALQLLMGPLTGALNLTDVPAGTLSRPAWAPGQNEVWIGDGARLLRIASSGLHAVPVNLSSTSGAITVTGAIRSVAFSPDGVRIALIISAADGSSQLWIGTIVRTADGASVESLEAISPAGFKLTDVAWNDVSTLYTIGDDTTRHTYGIWSIQVDGSFLSSRSVVNLPGSPDSITASQEGVAWVSANTAVWVQQGPESTWTAPRGGLGTTFGTYPTYVE